MPVSRLDIWRATEEWDAASSFGGHVNSWVRPSQLVKPVSADPQRNFPNMQAGQGGPLQSPQTDCIAALSPVSAWLNARTDIHTPTVPLEITESAHANLAALAWSA